MSDVSRAYQRGRYASEKRWRLRLDRVIEIARGIQSRADGGQGACGECRYFTRHRNTHWGTCIASSDADIPAVSSASVTWFRPENGGAFNVGEDFGCIHWAAKGGQK